MTEVLCPTCAQLLREYRVATDHFIEAVKEVARATGTWEFDYFDRVWCMAVTAHRRSNEIRTELSRHLESHPLN